MNITVLGSGNGGLAVAYEWAHLGHPVTLYSPHDYAHNVEAVHDQGGIHCDGQLSGFAPVAQATKDIDAAMAGAEVVFVVGPAYATDPMARYVAPYLKPGMIVVVCPGSCMGAVAFKAAAGLDLHDESVLVGETSTLPYASRVTEPGRVHMFHRFDRGLYAAAAPRAGNARLLELIRFAYPEASEATSVLQTTLQNGNPVIHPAVCLLNGRLMDTATDFNFYEDGVSDAVGRLMRGVDEERIAIGAALGVEILSEPAAGVLQGYMIEDNYVSGYNQAPGFKGIKAPTTLDNRYFTEDIGYTQVFFTDLARRLGVPTPIMDAEIALVSLILGHDYRAEGLRTLASLGLDRLTIEQLKYL